MRVELGGAPSVGGHAGSHDPSVRNVAHRNPRALNSTQVAVLSCTKFTRGAHAVRLALNVHAGSHELWNVALAGVAPPAFNFKAQTGRPVLLVDLGGAGYAIWALGRLTTALILDYETSLSTLLPRS